LGTKALGILLIWALAAFPVLEPADSARFQFQVSFRKERRVGDNFFPGDRRRRVGLWKFSTSVLCGPQERDWQNPKLDAFAKHMPAERSASNFDRASDGQISAGHQEHTSASCVPLRAAPLLY
jgi:hypothetical protein